jgi:hypothetical protein
MISLFLIIRSPGKIQLKMKKKGGFWRTGERMLLRAGYEAVPRASPPVTVLPNRPRLFRMVVLMAPADRSGE